MRIRGHRCHEDYYTEGCNGDLFTVSVRPEKNRIMINFIVLLDLEFLHG